MGVVARPIPHRNFNGKIFLERVSETKYVTSTTAHTNFSDDVIVNDDIEKGEWRDLMDETMTSVEDINLFIIQIYSLEEAVADRLELYYVTKTGNNGNTKKIVLEDNDLRVDTFQIITHDNKNMFPRSVVMTDINLHIRNIIGDLAQIDCMCDSEYMTDAMVRVGTAIRQAYHWINPTDPCYLVMDNVRGHRTKDCINEYTTMLLTDFNIVVIFQIP